MAKKGSNIYSQPESRADNSVYGSDPNDLAESIADAALRNESLSPNDDLFKTGDAITTAIVHPNDGRTARDRAKSNHAEPTPAHPRAEHEKVSLRDEAPTHAQESYRGKDED